MSVVTLSQWLTMSYFSGLKFHCYVPFLQDGTAASKCQLPVTACSKWYYWQCCCLNYTRCPADHALLPSNHSSPLPAAPHSAVTVLRLQDVCGMLVSFRRIRKWGRNEFLLPTMVSEGRMCIFAGNIISGALWHKLSKCHRQE